MAYKFKEENKIITNKDELKEYEIWKNQLIMIQGKELYGVDCYTLIFTNYINNYRYYYVKNKLVKVQVFEYQENKNNKNNNNNKEEENFEFEDKIIKICKKINDLTQKYNIPYINICNCSDFKAYSTCATYYNNNNNSNNNSNNNNNNNNINNKQNHNYKNIYLYNK